VRIKVRIRFNPESGQFEEFRVLSDGVPDPGGTHDDRHEAAAREIASEIEVNPELIEEGPQRGPDPNPEEIAQANEAVTEMVRERGVSG
jgi:hypothetical protein